RSAEMDHSSFVRKEMLAPRPAPVSETGAIGWMRQKLFSGPLNIFLTVVSLAIIFWVVAHTAPWFINGVWKASSLAECREILNGATGACWAVITERWHQLIFGFYPPELYWRPILAFVL